MNKSTKYDPEDIESLMLHKSFNELYPEEKEFVLRYMDSEQEYASMRETLSKIKDANSHDTTITPNEHIKEDLLAKFHTQKKKGFIVWLNGILPFSSSAKEAIHWRPIFQIGLTSLVLLLGIGYFLWQNNPTDEVKNIAEVKEKVKEKTEDKVEDKAENKIVESKESQTEGENASNAIKEFKVEEELTSKTEETIEEVNADVEFDNRMVEELKEEDLRDAKRESLISEDELLIAEVLDVVEDEAPLADFDTKAIVIPEVAIAENETFYYDTDNTDDIAVIQDANVATMEPAITTTLSNAGVNVTLEKIGDHTVSQLHTPLSSDYDLISQLYTAP